MNPVIPTEAEEEALFTLLKRNEAGLSHDLQRFLNRLEKSLYSRMTVEQIEKLKDA